MYLTIFVHALFVSSFLCEPSTECEEVESSEIIVSVFSHRNATGHLSAEVDISTNGMSRMASSDIKEDNWVVDVIHSTTRCKGVAEGTSTVQNIKLIFSQDSCSTLRNLDHKSLCHTGAKRREIHPDYEHFPGLGYYKFHTQPETWDHAREICQAEGADLIVVNSDRESSLVKQLYTRHPSLPGASHNDWIWVGAYEQVGLPRQFKTMNGASLRSTGFISWAHGHPHPATSGIGGYVLINRQGLLGTTYHEEKESFICEYQI